MDFLKKAKSGLKDVEDIQKSLKKFGIGKDKPASPAADPSSDKMVGSPPPSTYTPQSSYAPPSSASLASPSTTYDSTPIATPSTSAPGGVQPESSGLQTVEPQIDLNIPRNPAPDAPQKLSLAIRKKIRDDYEIKKPELEAQLTTVLGVPWKVHVDTLGVYSWSKGLSYPETNPGVCFTNYFKGAIDRLQSFKLKFGDEGIAQLNSVAFTHIATIEPATNPEVRYCSVDFEQGKLRIVFNTHHLGSNDHQALEDLPTVLSQAGKGAGSAGGSGKHALSLQARQSIKTEYEDKVAESLKLARKYLDAPTLEFAPNFEYNYATLAAFNDTLDLEDRDDRDKLRRDWETSIGRATLSYFQGFVSQLEWQKFKKDDMMQEGFKDSVDKLVVTLSIQENITRTRNDCIIENGVLVLRTNIANWYANVDNAAEGLSALL